MTLPKLCTAKRRRCRRPLAICRDRFGCPTTSSTSTATPQRLAQGRLPSGGRTVGREQWGTDLIASWNKHGWIDAAQRPSQAGIAPLIGANRRSCWWPIPPRIFLQAARGRGRAAGLGDAPSSPRPASFPSDLYVAQGLAAMLGLALRTVEPADADRSSGQCRYRGRHADPRRLPKRSDRHDMAAITAAAHSSGVLMLWDLSHSAGAVAVDLNGACRRSRGGCGYKYLNGGPGCPAFLFVRAALQEALRPPLQGWMGHSEPFAFDDEFEPATGVSRFLTGTPSILALAALECGLATFDGIAMVDVEARSRLLSQSFIDAVGAVRRSCPARQPARSGGPPDPRLLCPSSRLCGHAGADQAQGDRGFSCARPHALRLCSAVPEPGGRDPRRRHIGRSPRYMRLGPAPPSPAGQGRLATISSQILDQLDPVRERIGEPE